MENLLRLKQIKINDWCPLFREEKENESGRGTMTILRKGRQIFRISFPENAERVTAQRLEKGQNLPSKK